MTPTLDNPACCPMCGRPVRDSNVARAGRISARLTLTPGQWDLLFLFARLRDANGFSPSMRELAEDMERSHVTVYEIVGELVRKGALRNTGGKHKARALELAEA